MSPNSKVGHQVTKMLLKGKPGAAFWASLDVGLASGTHQDFPRPRANLTDPQCKLIKEIILEAEGTRETPREVHKGPHPGSSEDVLGRASTWVFTQGPLEMP